MSEHTHYIKVKDQNGGEHYVECSEHLQSTDSVALATAANLAQLADFALTLVSRGRKKPTN